ncbi:MAG TPA: response regulator, partial [Chitinispirillaceae bacterium]|nr:response regulator [Chitinispirillaceae bacterium]
FTPAGEVDIRATVASETEETVMVRFSVRDTGIGIPSDKSGLLFNKFTQLDASTTRKFGGTGLGLAISRQLTEMMGGQIGVTSKEGVGTEFWFTIRLQKQFCKILDSGNNSNLNKKSLFTGHSAMEQLRLFTDYNIRALIVEDNPINQQVALSILKKLGLKTEAVSNGAEAVKLLETIPFDVVLMDVQMPVMDGYEATACIRDPKSKVLNHEIPIIAMTANAMNGDREKCLDAGMDGYVSKPIDPVTVAGELEKWLKKIQTAGGEITSVLQEKPSGDSGEDYPVIWNKDAMLNRLMNDQELARTVLDGFIKDIPDQIDKLELLFQKSDLPSVGRQAHSIKGAATNIGGEKLQQIAYELELEGKYGNLETARINLEELKREFEFLTKEIAPFLKQ